MGLQAVMAKVVELEEQWAAKVNEQDPDQEVRVYEWRPTRLPELPCIYNWLEPSEYQLVDTAKGEDDLIVRATIAVKPSDIAENMGQLAGMFDTFKGVVDPALINRPPFDGAAKEAKRVQSHSVIDEFNDVPVLGIAIQLKIVLREVVAGEL